MNRERAKESFDRIISLWPDWKPDAIEQEEWLKVMLDFDQKDDIDSTVSEHYASKGGAFKRPRLCDIIQAAKRFAGIRAAEHRREQDKNFGPHFYLWKEGVPEMCKKPIVCYDNNGRIETNPDRILKHQEYQRKRHNEMYGENWIVMQSRNDEGRNF